MILPGKCNVCVKLFQPGKLNVCVRLFQPGKCNACVLLFQQPRIRARYRTLKACSIAGTVYHSTSDTDRFQCPELVEALAGSREDPAQAAAVWDFFRTLAVRAVHAQWVHCCVDTIARA